MGLTNFRFPQLIRYCLITVYSLCRCLRPVGGGQHSSLYHTSFEDKLDNILVFNLGLFFSLTFDFTEPMIVELQLRQPKIATGFSTKHALSLATVYFQLRKVNASGATGRILKVLTILKSGMRTKYRPLHTSELQHVMLYTT